MPRNYDNAPHTKKPQFPCPLCTKKYLTERKYQAHVEKAHYYCTRGQNSLTFTFDDQIQIWALAHEYVQFLLHIEEASAAELTARSIKLLPQHYGKSLDATHPDVVRMNAGQLKLAAKLREDDALLCYPWRQVLTDLQYFFQMGLPYFDTNFCPTLPMDVLWHAVMQDPTFYTRLCMSSCRAIIPHCALARSEEEDLKRHRYFLDVFRYRFGRLPGTELGPKQTPEIFLQLQARTRQEQDQHKEAERKKEAAREAIDREMQKLYVRSYDLWQRPLTPSSC